jgi:hypothetical protein
MSGETAVLAIVGGVLIGGASSGLLLFDGKIAGISGIAAGMLRPRPGDARWRMSFIAGPLFGGVLLRLLVPAAFAVAVRQPLLLTGVAGLLVGVGTRFAGGCTSGTESAGSAGAHRASASTFEPISDVAEGAAAAPRSACGSRPSPGAPGPEPRRSARSCTRPSDRGTSIWASES